MKKVLATGAALLLAGSIASVAVAEVNLSGDARARYISRTNYGVSGADTFTDTDTADKWNSRIRVKFDAKATGGAYAKARLRFFDQNWGGVGKAAYKNGEIADTNVWTDYAYIGIPMGAVTVEAGIMPAGFSAFFSDDERADRLKFTYKNDGFMAVALYDMQVEDNNSTDDMRTIGLVFSNKFNDNLSAKAYGRFQMDDREIEMDKSGFLGSVHVNYTMGEMAMEAEYAYKESDVLGTEDDGWGAYAQASFAMGAFTPSLNIGVTKDGYVADETFGFIMAGGDEPIMVGSMGAVTGAAADTTWFGAVAKYAVSEQMSLVGNLVYLDLDNVGSAYELSGSVGYAISEGATFSVKAGYLAPDFDDSARADEGAFGAYGRLEVNF